MKSVIILTFFILGGAVGARVHPSGAAPATVIPHPSATATATRSPAPAPGAVNPAWLREYARKMHLIFSIDADFTESKFFHLMSAPLITRGHIHIDKTPLIVRTVHEPYRETLRIQGDTAILEHPDTGETETFDLNGMPAFKLFPLLFSGDMNALNAAFHIRSRRVEGKGYRLELVPLDAAMKRMIRIITVDLDSRLFPHSIRYDEPGGDYTILLLEHPITSVSNTPPAIP